MNFTNSINEKNNKNNWKNNIGAHTDQYHLLLCKTGRSETIYKK